MSGVKEWIYENWIQGEWDKYNATDQLTGERYNPPIPFNIFELKMIGELDKKNRGGIIGLINDKRQG